MHIFLYAHFPIWHCVFDVLFYFKFHIAIAFLTYIVYIRGYSFPSCCIHLSYITVQTVHQIFSLSWFIGFIVAAGPPGKNSNLVYRFCYIYIYKYIVSWIYKLTTTTWQLLTSQFPNFSPSICIFLFSSSVSPTHGPLSVLI